MIRNHQVLARAAPVLPGVVLGQVTEKLRESDPPGESWQQSNLTVWRHE